MQTLSFTEVQLLQKRLFRHMSESATYDSWSADFARSNVTDFINEERKTKAIDPNVFTKAEAVALGFGNWDGKLLVAPLWMHRFLKEGIQLKSINEEVVTVTYDEQGKSNIDNDHRFGCIAYGVEYPEAEA